MGRSGQGGTKGQDARKARLAEALRANLKRRKAQERDRSDAIARPDDQKPDAAPASGDATD
jgi:hypothetical protein